jgi:hypothetical protein
MARSFRAARRRLTASVTASPISHAGDASSLALLVATAAQRRPPLPRISAAGFAQNPLMHAPLRHSAFPLHASSLGTPQAPSEKHTLLVHCVACAQVDSFTSPQVFVAALHLPEAHVACAFASVQPPSCSPSFGIGVPDLSFGRHVFSFRAQ